MVDEKRLDDIQKKAENAFATGTLYCSEAVLQTINEELGFPLPEEVCRMASGFPVGLGTSGCLCGAVAGGEMALGLVYGRVKGEPMNEKMFPAAAALHDYIKEEFGATCCRVMTRQWAGDNFMSRERAAHCIEITGKVARWVARRLMEDEKL